MDITYTGKTGKTGKTGDTGDTGKTEDTKETKPRKTKTTQISVPKNKKRMDPVIQCQCLADKLATHLYGKKCNDGSYGILNRKGQLLVSNRSDFNVRIVIPSSVTEAANASKNKVTVKKLRRLLDYITNMSRHGNRDRFTIEVCYE